jgi:hypothetical protein
MRVRYSPCTAVILHKQQGRSTDCEGTKINNQKVHQRRNVRSLNLSRWFLASCFSRSASSSCLTRLPCRLCFTARGCCRVFIMRDNNAVFLGLSVPTTIATTSQEWADVRKRGAMQTSSVTLVAPTELTDLSRHTPQIF